MPKLQPDILRELRKRSGLRQQDVAKALNISRSCYSKYERGIRQPGCDVLLALSGFFDVSIAYLTGQTRYPRSYIPDNDTAYRLFESISRTREPELEYLISLISDPDADPAGAAALTDPGRDMRRAN